MVALQDRWKKRQLTSMNEKRRQTESSSLLGQRVSDTILPVRCQTIRSKFEDEMGSPLVFTGPLGCLPAFSSSHG